MDGNHAGPGRRSGSPLIHDAAVADISFMPRLVKETWLATVVFAALSRLDVTHCGWMLEFGPTVTALIVVPPIWRGFVTQHGRPRIGRAALAGATCGFLIEALVWMIASAWGEAHSPRFGDPVGAGMGNLQLVFAVLFAALVGGPVGAGIGALVAFVQSRCWPSPLESSRDADSIRDGAMRGAMIAMLASPFATILACAALPQSLLPQSGGAPSLGILFLATWLTMIPAGALLGAKRVGRRHRIPAAEQASMTAAERTETRAA